MVYYMFTFWTALTLFGNRYNFLDTFDNGAKLAVAHECGCDLFAEL
ncbi:hypothetical protein HanPSC8_Chr13g0559141 [Helianthus annuus]|nr:hypothetical protein HanLR1_Chr13g0478411 [Helianthus annuus]KAJ0848577.1 hypothetical protein HanPSC8_Chr13g0559141 [Helianthus annuus]